MRIELSKDAIKYLARLDKSTEQRILKAVSNLSHEPPIGDIKPLQGQRNMKRLRVGNLRILFKIDVQNSIILITEISPRGDAYK